MEITTNFEAKTEQKIKTCSQFSFAKKFRVLAPKTGGARAILVRRGKNTKY